MGKITAPLQGKLIMGFITSDLQVFEKVKGLLEKRFGLIDYESNILDFNKTDYYEKEMGKFLKRRFCSFTKLILPDQLPSIKLYTNDLEKEVACKNGQRKINIDPGYLTSGKLVLATTKNQQHRVYLTGGIYAEVTLRFKKRSFIPWDWTYPDYRTDEYIETFNNIRKLYMEHNENKVHK